MTKNMLGNISAASDQIQELLDRNIQLLSKLEDDYADVHNGPYMKVTFDTIDFKNYVLNPLISKGLNLLFHFSPQIKQYKKKYGNDFPVYGLLSKTTQYKNIAHLMISFVKDVRQKLNLSSKITLEFHTGTGNSSAEYLIPNLKKEKWIITDRESHNLKYIQRSLQVNHLNNSDQIYAGLLDFSRRVWVEPQSLDEMIGHFGCYFGNKQQTHEAFLNMNKLLKKDGVLYLSGFTHPHNRINTIQNFFYENLKGKYLMQSLLNRNILLTILYAVFTKATTEQWSKDIEENRLYLLDEKRLKKICDETGFRVIDRKCFTHELHKNKTETSNVWAFALQKTN